MATYNKTELGQVQSSLNALNQKLKRKVEKAKKIKSEQESLTAKLDDLSRTEKVKKSRLDFEKKQIAAEIASLREECKHLKEIQGSKRAKKKKEKEEIFHDEGNKEDAYLASLYGVDVEQGGNQESSNVVPFKDM